MQEPSATAITPELSPVPAAIDPAWLDALITSGDHVMTPGGPIPVGSPLEQAPPQLLEHEKTLLAAVLRGPADQRERWGLFRRRIGLRFDETVSETLWSTAALRAIASEIDAIFRGQRDITTLNAAALREALRERAAAGRWKGSLQQTEESLAELIAWGENASALDFPIACELFQSAKARRLFYPALRRLLEREHQDRAIEAELRDCRQVLNEAIAITAGRFRQSQPVCSPTDAARECVELAGLPAEQRPVPISTGIPSLDLDMRGGVLAGQGESTWVLAARSGVGKTTVAIAAAMGLACNGAGVLFFSCELSRRAIGARLMAHYCRGATGRRTSQFSTNDLEGRGRVIAGEDLQQLQRWAERFSQGQRPDGQPMGQVLYRSQFGASVEEFCELVEDTKAAHPELSVVLLDHFHAMGSTPGYGSNTTAELAARAMALKALAGRCQIDVIVVAQLNRGAYAAGGGPDVSHLAGTSELERYASAVWLIEQARNPDGSPGPREVLEVHHGKFRHGQMADGDLTKTVIHLDRAHCFLEADEARLAFVGHHLYPGVAVP